MALDLNGFAVFRAIASAPKVFKAITIDVNKTARALATKQLKAKGADIQNLRDVRRTLGTEFDLVLEGMKPSELRTLARKFDKYHPELAAADERWCLRHLNALASGFYNPVEKTKAFAKEKGGPKSRRRKKPEPERLSSRAMGAVRKRLK
jgi:hypothetical protein